MKKIAVLLCFIFIGQTVLSQRGGTLGSLDPDGSSALGPMSRQPTVNASAVGNIGSLYSQSSKYSYENVYLDGSQYLFNSWKNHGTILVGEKKYIIPNINFNMDKQVFMSKIEDSVLVYDFNRIDKVLVNGKLFKRVYNTKEQNNKVYEILYSCEYFSILKENFISIVEASPNPMLNRPNRKVKQKSNYFVYNKGEFKPLKLKKDAVLNLFHPDQMKLLENYAENYKLSFKKPDDVDKILAYAN